MDITGIDEFGYFCFLCMRIHPAPLIMPIFTDGMSTGTLIMPIFTNGMSMGPLIMPIFANDMHFI